MIIVSDTIEKSQTRVESSGICLTREDMIMKFGVFDHVDCSGVSEAEHLALVSTAIT
jgi:hypothetical protein